MSSAPPDALAFGLIHELVLPFELEERAFQLASGLASPSPAAVSSGLAFAARFGAESSGTDKGERLRRAIARPECQEAIAAVRGKRKPE